MLTNAGFTKNENKVYTALLKLGIARSGEIISHSGVGSSRVFAALTKLSQHGLVSTVVKNNISYYKVEPPVQLIDVLTSQVRELESVSKVAESAAAAAESKRDVAVYEGVRGHHQAFLQHIQMVEPKSELNIVEYGRSYRLEKNLNEFFGNKLTPVIAKKKCRIQMIVGESLLNPMHRKLAKRLDIEFRVLSSKYFGSMALDLSPKEVMLTIVGGNPVAICLREERVVDGFKKHFRLLWSLAKPISLK